MAWEKGCVIATGKKIRVELGCAAVTLRQELHALALSARGRNAVFRGVMECLHGIKGSIGLKVMVKNGHATCRVAVSMTSTESPACFVHSGEARYDVLDMPAFGGAVLNNSLSVYTVELSDVVHIEGRHAGSRFTRIACGSG